MFSMIFLLVEIISIKRKKPSNAITETFQSLTSAVFHQDSGSFASIVGKGGLVAMSLH